MKRIRHSPKDQPVVTSSTSQNPTDEGVKKLRTDVITDMVSSVVLSSEDENSSLPLEDKFDSSSNQEPGSSDSDSCDDSQEESQRSLERLRDIIPYIVDSPRPERLILYCVKKIQKCQQWLQNRHQAQEVPQLNWAHKTIESTRQYVSPSVDAEISEANSSDPVMDQAQGDRDLPKIFDTDSGSSTDEAPSNFSSRIIEVSDDESENVSMSYLEFKQELETKLHSTESIRQEEPPMCANEKFNYEPDAINLIEPTSRAASVNSAKMSLPRFDNDEDRDVEIGAVTKPSKDGQPPATSTASLLCVHASVDAKVSKANSSDPVTNQAQGDRDLPNFIDPNFFGTIIEVSDDESEDVSNEEFNYEPDAINPIEPTSRATNVTSAKMNLPRLDDDEDRDLEIGAVTQPSKDGQPPATSTASLLCVHASVDAKVSTANSSDPVTGDPDQAQGDRDLPNFIDPNFFGTIIEVSDDELEDVSNEEFNYELDAINLIEPTSRAASVISAKMNFPRLDDDENWDAEIDATQPSANTSNSVVVASRATSVTSAKMSLPRFDNDEDWDIEIGAVMQPSKDGQPPATSTASTTDWDDENWDNELVSAPSAAIANKQTSPKRRSILDLDEYKVPNPNKGRFVRERTENVRNSVYNGCSLDCEQQYYMAFDMAGPPIHQRFNKKKPRMKLRFNQARPPIQQDFHQARPPMQQGFHGAAQPLQQQPLNADPRIRRRERINVDVFLAKLFSPLCHDFLESGSCGISGNCDLLCKKQFEKVDMYNIFKLGKWLNQEDLMKFFNESCTKCVCFNKFFPTLAHEFGGRKMVEPLIKSIQFCERPGYILSHFKWIVHGLIRANYSPLQAINALLFHLKQDSVEAREHIIDMIIKSEEEMQFFDVIMLYVSSPPYPRISVRSVDRLIFTTFNLKQRKWIDLLINVMTNCLDQMEGSVMNSKIKERLEYEELFVQNLTSQDTA